MKRRLALIGLVCGLAALAVTLVVRSRFGLESPRRKEWARASIAAMSAVSSDPLAASNMVAAVRRSMAGDISGEGSWFTTNAMFMGDGSWIMYRAVCHKETAGISDLFVGVGSDQKWYYSTYHFCKGMVALSIEDQPVSLGDFAGKYHLQSFDGSADQCLGRTWPTKQAR